MADHEFRYSPLTGRLTGKQMIEQTEQAINALASQVDSAAGQVEIISTLANEANENAATALETAEEALATTSRTYITVSTQTDANNYYDSQLIYIADSTSTNIPVADTGMLEVKTNDNKTACEQVFISDSSGDAYYRNGAITAKTVGAVTTYSVTWSGWSSQPASQAYVQGELTNYLPLSGGTLTGKLQSNVQSNVGTVSIELLTTGTFHRDIQTFSADGNHRIGVIRMEKDSSNNCKVLIGANNTSNDAPSGITITRGTSGNSVITGITPPAGDNSTKIATTEFVNAKAGNYLPLSGGTMTGDINMNRHNLIGGQSSNTGIYCTGNDNGGTLGTTGANINIKSWYGVGFINGLSSSNTYNKVTVGIDVREGIVHAKSFDGNATSATKATNDGNGKNIASTYLPAVVGAVVAFAGRTTPQGWLLCDGSAVSRTDYAALFAVIGTTYGSGNGSTTFNLPNLVDKFVEGSATAGTVKSAGLPNITGKLSSKNGINGVDNTNQFLADKLSEVSGAFSVEGWGAKKGMSDSNNGGYGYDALNFNASHSNSIYGKSSTVQPPALTMRYIIKY